MHGESDKVTNDLEAVAMLRRRVPLLAVVLLLTLFAGFAYATRDSGGTYSLPPGINPVVSGTTISSNWANTTLNDLKNEMTDSLSRSGKGGMTAPLALANGAAATPALTWTSEPNSGLYRAAAGDIRGAVNGTDITKWQTSGFTSLVPLNVTGRTTTTNLTVSGLQDATTFTPQAANTTSATFIGTGTATSLVVQSAPTGTIAASFSCGAGNCQGVNSSGFGTAAGVSGIGGASAGQGVLGMGGASGIGVQGSGGTSSGIGVYGLGGGPNGIGSRGDGQGTAPGLYGIGGTTGAGVFAQAGTSTTGAARTDAVKLSNGDINLDGVAVPTSTTALKNRLTPNSFTKGWASITITGVGTITTNAAMNVGAAVDSGGAHTSVLISWAQAFSSANYAITLASSGGSVCHATFFNKTASSVNVSFLFPASGGGWQGCDGTGGATSWANTTFDITAIGAQ